MSEQKEKDYSMHYIAIGIILFASAIYMVKNSESGKFQKAAELIQEDSSNSAYLTRP